MGFWNDLFGIETRSAFIAPRLRSEQEIEAAISNDNSDSEETINTHTALAISTVHNCVRLLADGLAQPQCSIFKPTADGLGREEVTNHPLYDLLTMGPNPRQDGFAFRRQIGMHLAMGDAFVKISRSNVDKNKIIELNCIDPSRMTVDVKTDGTIRYKIAGDGTYYSETDIWHIRSLSWNGAESLPIIEQARLAMGLARSSERYGSRLFKNGAMVRSFITAPDGMTKEQKDDFVQRWSANYSGVKNAHKTPLLAAGMDMKSVGSTANEAQWTESRKYQTEEICRFFNIRPNMVMQTGATSYASVEQEFIAHHKHTLGPLHTSFEQSAAKALLTLAERKAGYRIKLNSNSLLRGSTQERVAYYNSGTEHGWLTANEVRALEDLPRSDDPSADTLKPAANLFGDQSKNEVKK